MSFARAQTAKETDTQSLPFPLKNLMGRVWVALILQQQNEKVYCAFVLGDTEGRKIDGALNRSLSTISRELQRNLVKGAYSAHEAGKLYRLRRKRCRPAFKLENKGLRQILQSRLEEGWPPEQIKGRESFEVSVTTIYRAVKSGRLPFEARKHLRHKGKPYKRKTRQDGRGRIKDAVSIELRPKEVEQRLEIGNWEVDTVLGKPGSGGLVSVVDRTSRLLLAAKIEDKTASGVHTALIRLLEGMECRSLTTDNGKEFA